MASATISVIIPLYNKEREIGDTLRSVLAQTLQPTEIVVVDDGSTDGSADAVRAIASPLVKLVTQANAGVCAARNRAIAESAGDLIALLDADDTWEPGFLEEIASMAAEFPGCGIYSTAFNIVSHDGRFPAPHPHGARRGRRLLPRLGAPLYLDPVGQRRPARGIRISGRIPRGNEDRRGSLHVDQDRPALQGLLFAQAAGKLFEGGLEPFVGHLHARADALLVRGALRPGGGRRIQRVRGPRSPGKSAHHQRKGGTKDAARAIRFFGYTKTYRRTLRKVRILNALPAAGGGR